MNFKITGLYRIIINIFITSLFVTGNVYARGPENEMLDKGKDYFKKKMYDQAVIAFGTAIQINLRYGSAYYYRGRAYTEKGNLDEAISDFTKAIEIKPNHAKAYYRRGLAYAKKSDLDHAISDFTKAIEIDPKLVWAYNNRIAAYFLKQEYGKCWEDVHRLEVLGEKLHPEFLEQLKKLSGRER